MANGEFAWPVAIALYLYLAGVSAGMFATAIAARFLNGGFRQVHRWGSLLAPLPILLGILFLIIDLGSPARFWYLLVYVNPRSVMSMGTFLITFFSVIATLYAWHTLHAEGKVRFTLLPRPLLTLVEWTGIAFSVAVGTYTAFLLNASVAIALWNSGVLPLIFLASSMSTGVAAVIVAVALAGRWPEVREQVTRLALADAVLVALELFAVAAFVWSFHVGTRVEQAALAVLNQEFGMAFWGGVVFLGMLVPLAIKVLRRRHSSAAVPVASAALVLLGGLIFRIVIVIAGQTASPLY